MRCKQLVTINNCCDPEQCPASASMWQPATESALCAEHYGNAVKYALDGTWHVGRLAVTFPEGWVEAPAAPEGEPSALAPVEPATSSGLVIETAPLSSSGLVLER